MFWFIKQSGLANGCIILVSDIVCIFCTFETLRHSSCDTFSIAVKKILTFYNLFVCAVFAHCI